MPENFTSAHTSPRRRMTKFTIDELSAVDVPAQEGARALILKRAEDHLEKFPEENRVVGVLTSTVNGHAHLVWLHPGDRAGLTSSARGPGEEDDWHDHPWILKDGVIIIGENDGHPHSVDPQDVLEVVFSKNDISSRHGELVSIQKLRDDYGIEFKRAPNSEETGMPDNKPTGEQMSDEVRERLANAEKQADLATRALQLSAEQLAHYRELSAEERETFLNKSDADRETEVSKKADADPVVYTDSGGREYRKSAGEQLIQLAKDRDADRQALVELQKAQENESFLKRAEEELGHLPGDLATRAATLRAIENIPDEATRKAALESIHAGNKAMKAAFDRVGVSGEPSSDSAEAQLDDLARKRAQEKDIDHYEAYDQVARENPDLAKRAVEGQ